LPVCSFWPATACAFQIYPLVLVVGLCNETDPEFDVRFEADEEYVGDLIDRIEEMTLRGVKPCNRCTEKHPGEREGAVRGVRSEC
jgi:hypothetical protein